MMIDPLESFIGMARRIRLTAEEESQIQQAIRNAVRMEKVERHHSTMDEQTFLRSAKTIALTPHERASAKAYVLSVIHQTAERHWWLSPFKNLTSITASFLILMLAGASVSYAAESAMPGDILYPVKMHVNEKIETSMARTPMARAIVASAHAEKRLKEAEMLAQKSALDMEKQKMLAEEVRRNVAMAQAEADTLMVEHRMDEAGMIGVSLEASLNAHTRLLARLDAEHEGNHMQELMDTLHETRMSVEESTMAMNNTETVAAVLASARSEIRRAAGTLKRTTAENLTDAEEQLSKAETALAATDSGRNISGEQAFRLARTALRRAKEAAVFTEMPSPVAASPTPTLMMKTATMKIESGAAAQNDGLHDDDDVRFDASVRMRMTEKTLGSIEQRLNRHGETIPEEKTMPVKTRVNGSRELMDMAKKEMQDGNMNTALDVSDEALKHANEASKALQSLMPDDED